MKRVLVAGRFLLVCIVASSSPYADAAGEEVSSVFDGVFTLEQSARGKIRYLETCERCHKKDLAGDATEEIPPLVGDKFLSNWSKWTVGDLFERSSTKMPPKSKDRLHLSDEEYADILAYILEQNGFPTGDAELPPSIDPLLEIEMSRGE
jgi:cytochrome c553